MNATFQVAPIDILLIEDNPGDVRLAREALQESKIQNDVHVVTDGRQAIAFLRKEGEYADALRPDLILLDLNLPWMDGREVLAEIKADAKLRRIPVVVLTVSKADRGRCTPVVRPPRQLLPYQAHRHGTVHEAGTLHQQLLALHRQAAAEVDLCGSMAAGQWATANRRRVGRAATGNGADGQSHKR